MPSGPEISKIGHYIYRGGGFWKVREAQVCWNAPGAEATGKQIFTRVGPTLWLFGLNLEYSFSMDVLIGDRPRYKTIEMIGEGTAGRVFKALRWDKTYKTKQLVAMKILKSKKDVQILRKEFSRLKRIHSPYCVQLLGWENLKLGPALILEFLEGVNLFELSSWGRVPDFLIVEIIAQVQIGLQDLARQGLFHGDLSPKNIFITSQGKVKLVDFGSVHRKDMTFANPQYKAPELDGTWRPDLQSDLFSLGIIEHQLRKGLGWKEPPPPEDLMDQSSLLINDRTLRRPIPCQPSPRLQKKLGNLVKSVQAEKAQVQETQFLGTEKRVRSQSWRRSWVCLFWFLGVFSASLKEEASSTDFSSLDIRVSGWAKISLNDLPFQYVPAVFKNLRKGRYSLRWKKAKSIKEKSFFLNSDSAVIVVQD